MIGVGVIDDTASAHGVGALVDLSAAWPSAWSPVTSAAVARRVRRAAGWVTPGGERIVVLMLAGVAFLAAEEIGVNYFVAAFVAGIAFRAGIGEDDEEVTALPELIGQVLALAVWFAFGAQSAARGPRDRRLAHRALRRAQPDGRADGARRHQHDRRRIRRPARPLFIGWFGPRGLASVVFGLLIVEELPVDDPAVQTVLSTIVLTVLLSVIAHGVSARPLTAWLGRTEPAPDRDADEGPIRHRPRFGRRSA